MIDFTEIPDGETWELFARDFLMERGFYIESAPDRGADAGKDMLITERLTGALGTYEFRWLVSCKHNAASGKAVNEHEEKNVLERMESMNADGFLGFYSTVPSAGFNTRLTTLKTQKKLKDYRIFDHKLIESDLIRIGYSFLLQRYFPASYRQIKPINQIFTEYLPLKCEICHKDLLEDIYTKPHGGIVGFVYGDEPKSVDDMFFVCKGSCDHKLDRKFTADGRTTGWNELGDLVIPTRFLQFWMGKMNVIRSGETSYSDKAYDKLKTLILVISQKVLRENTEKETDHVDALMDTDHLFG